ncbi:hypothetical protein MKX01_019117 [Papaver californicum]|nr:hypothetical protein MKX01_019117 [Papaver californicum]
MRAGLSTIQQTLTPEAASVLNHSIAEAARRNHGQTTPLHVAATLLSSPTGYLRQACIRSHPNSSHPLQCRALELCFSVALERLPSAQNSSPGGLEPPISNALMAALKRAQAHQRRGCPEQQQQPLLAVKVELEQLIVSILDDPSVSRVMREASFSSPAVKTTIEQSLNSTSSVVKSSSSSIGSGLGFRPSPMAAAANRNLYLNPRLQQQQQQQQGSSDQSGQQRKDEVKKVFDVFFKTKKRNPVLVGDSEPEPVMKELLQKIDNKELGGEGILRNVQVITLDIEFTADRTQISAKVKELGDSIETRLSSTSGGVILNLGDLKWLVEQNQASGGVLGSNPMQQQQMVSEMGKTAVAEMGKLLERFGEGSNGKLWLIGTATCETYLRCQVYHPTMENDWDLQAVPVAARNPPPGFFPGLGGHGSLESRAPMKGLSIAATALSRRPSENMDPSKRTTTCCPLCKENSEKEVAKLAAELEKSSSDSKQESARQPLPQWLQIAKPQNDNINSTDHSNAKDQQMILKQKTEEIQKKWNLACLRLHPSFHRHNMSSERSGPTAMPMANLNSYKANLLNRQHLPPTLQINKNLGGRLQMNPSLSLNPPERRSTPPRSPVRTELILGNSKLQESTLDETHMERIRDLAGCISSDPVIKDFEAKKDKLASILDPDSFKSLFKGLLEKVWWQQDAASAVASSVVQSKSGDSKRRGFGLKGETWLLFAGPDRIGKKKMASTLAELVGRQTPVTIRLGSRLDEDEESDMSFRGKTTLDRIAEVVRKNPFSVVILEDIDHADMLVHGSIKRAMDRGRLPDSHGREISLGNVIFILTADWLPDNAKNFPKSAPLNEVKLSSIAQSGWELELSGEKTVKRRPDWLRDEIRSTKPRTDMGSSLSFDLNETADAEEDMTDRSRNSSGVTVEQEQEYSLMNKLQAPVTSSTLELFKSVDDEIIFNPIDFGLIRNRVAATISSRFSSIIGDRWSITVDEEALEQIVGGVWFGQSVGLEEWIDRILTPNFRQLKTTSLASDGNVAVKLVLVKISSEKSRIRGDWLPSKVTVAIEET